MKSLSVLFFFFALTTQVVGQSQHFYQGAPLIKFASEEGVAPFKKGGGTLSQMIAFYKAGPQYGDLLFEMVRRRQIWANTMPFENKEQMFQVLEDRSQWSQFGFGYTFETWTGRLDVFGIKNDKFVLIPVLSNPQDSMLTIFGDPLLRVTKCFNTVHIPEVRVVTMTRIDTVFVSKEVKTKETMRMVSRPASKSTPKSASRVRINEPMHAVAHGGASTRESMRATNPNTKKGGKSSSKGKGWFKKTLVGTLVAGAVAGTVLGIKSLLNRPKEGTPGIEW